MPRRGGSGARSAPRAPSRPTAAPATARAPQQQSRPTSTAVAPMQQKSGVPGKPGQRQPAQGGGFLSNVASTAAGVSLGHAISGFFGGHSPAPVEVAPQQDNAAQPYDSQYGMMGSQQQTNSYGDRVGSGIDCGDSAKQLGDCLANQNGDMGICNYYLEQLKACRAAAADY